MKTVCLHWRLWTAEGQRQFSCPFHSWIPGGQKSRRDGQQSKFPNVRSHWNVSCMYVIDVKSVLFSCRWNINRNMSRRLRARPALKPGLRNLLWPERMQKTSVRWCNALLHIQYLWFTSYVVTSLHMVILNVSNSFSMPILRNMNSKRARAASPLWLPLDTRWPREPMTWPVMWVSPLLKWSVMYVTLEASKGHI